AMESRLALVVQNRDELLQQLATYQIGKTATGIHQAEITTHQARLAQQKTAEAIVDLIDQNELTQLAQLWIEGVDIDWTLLYPQGVPLRISLPTYPFAKERYWISTNNSVKPASTSEQPNARAQTSSRGKIVLKSIQKDTSTTHPMDNHPDIITADISALGDDVTLTASLSEKEAESAFLANEEGGGVTSTQSPPLNARIQPSLSQIRANIEALLRDILYLAPSIPITNDKPFAEYGLDSITGVEFTKQLNELFSLNLTATLLYQSPTLNDLSELVFNHLSEKYLEQGEKLSQQAAPSINQTPEDDSNLSAHPETTSSRLSAFKETDVAIIGMSGRFPGAATLDAYWDNLAQGVCSVTEVPLSRWDPDQFYDIDPEKPEKSISKWGGFLDNVDQFDTEFFNISPVEAAAMDPQQRLVLEEVYHTMEQAGYGPGSDDNQRCGLYVGSMGGQEYADLQDGEHPAQALMGTINAALAGRAAYALNLKGPVIAIDTACSSALVAIDMACKSLINQEADAMLAGGVTLYLTEKPYIAMSKATMLSPDGLCKTFDQQADGFVPGEGVGFVMLKLLSRAIADNDTIYGVIKGSGINQDGKTNGLTAPNLKAQQALQEQVYQTYGINPSTISYVEAHGTGTKLGDPIEVEALTASFQKYSASKQYCALGSVKTNLGHTSAAAGVASLIKVLLAMKHQQIPPSLHFSHPNEHIKFEETPFYVNTALQSWRPQGGILRAAINAFGFTGTNAHLIVEAYRPSTHQNPVSNNSPHLILLSAKNKAQLHNQVKTLLDYLETADTPSLVDVAYTLQLGRAALDHRLSLVTTSLEDLVEQLRHFAQGQSSLGNVYQGDTKASNLAVNFLAEGEAGETFVRTIIENRAFGKLAQLWVSGIDIDWTLLYPNQKPHRIALPGYPFTRRRYWVGEGNIEFQPDSTPSQLPNANTHSTYQFVWQPDGIAIEDTEALISDCIALFYHDPNIADTANALLKTKQLILIKLGDRFTETNPSMYEIDANNLEDYRRIFRRLEQESLSSTQIVYQGASQENLPHGPVKIIHHCITALLASELKTRQMVVLHSKKGSHADATVEALGGYARSLALVGITFRKVCVAGTPVSDEQQLLALAVELNQTNDGQFHEVLYRDNQRYLKAIEPLPLPQSGQTLLRSRGVYWITGGQGGLGLVFARHLAERYQATLILTGRSRLDKTIEKNLATLKSLGATEAIYLPSDVSSREAMTDIFQQINARYGQLNGVIHAAGVQSPELIHQKSWGEAKAVLAPKIEGTLVLDAVTKDAPLDIFVLFSSISAVVGDFGQSDYAIANRFMDEYARERAHLVDQNQRFGRSISLNWPLWQAGGMSLSPESETLYLKSSGQQPLDINTGINLFEASLHSSHSQVIIFSGQTQRIRRFLGLDNNFRQTDHSQGAPTLSSTNKTDHSTTPYGGDGDFDLERLILADLKMHVSAVIKIAPARLDSEENLGIFGFDSILLKQLAVQIERHYGIELTPAIFFQHSTLASLTRFLMTAHQAAMSAHYQGHGKGSHSTDKCKVL
ncbi:MAG: SDR family NAD(P)-dependent oxidoreductase, partial [Chloroflexota bacterium]